MTEYIPYKMLSDEQKAFVDSDAWQDRVKAIDEGYCFNRFLDDADPRVRAALAYEDYAHETLKEDPEGLVRAAVARRIAERDYVDLKKNDFQVGNWKVHLVDITNDYDCDEAITYRGRCLGKFGLPFVELYDMNKDLDDPVSTYQMEILLGLQQSPYYIGEISKSWQASLIDIASCGRSFELDGTCPVRWLSNEETMQIGAIIEKLAEVKYQDRIDQFRDPEIIPDDRCQPSLKESCEQAKQASAGLNSQIKNQPTKTQEAR